MAIQFDITKKIWNRETRKEEYYSIIVELHDEETMDLPEFIELEDEMIAREMGFEPEHPEEMGIVDGFYNEGLSYFLKYWTEEVFDALNEEGFKTIDTGTFSEILEEIVINNEGYTEVTIGILSNFVSHDDNNPIATMDKDRFEKILCDALKNGIGSDTCDEYILNAIVDVRGDTDFFRYEPGSPGESYNDEPYQTTHTYNPRIYINDKIVVEWKRIIKYEIHDPITFYGQATDLCESCNEFCTPDIAEQLLSFFNIDEEDLEDPPEPSHPESDDDGGFAVLYERFPTEWIRGKGQVIQEDEDPEERVVVPYSEKNEAQEAIWLSESIFQRNGEVEQWRMTILRRKTEEELDEYLREKDIRERQMSLFTGEETEIDTLLDEWVVLEE